jgi:predicted RNA binding protein YcfA (HicA-like mRNA interferase family)
VTRLPQLTARELISFLSNHHFEPVRQKGSHLTLWHPVLRLVVTIPVHPGRTLGRGLAMRILKDAGFTVDDFLADR